MTLNWLAPDENTDGSAITDLAGFNVYYGTDSANLDHTVNIQGVGNLSYVAEDLPDGTWYFSITAVNSEGFESSATTPVQTTL